VVTAAPGSEVDSADDFGEEFSVEIGEEDSDRAGFAGNEAASAAVWDVAETRGDVADSSAGFFADEGAAVEYAGHCSDGNVSFTGYVFDRDQRFGV